MPITITYDPVQRLVAAVYRGVITDDELVATWGDFYRRQTLDPDLREFDDLSEADGHLISPEAIRRLVAQSAATYPRLGIQRCRIAILASSQLAFGLSRMYSLLVDESRAVVRVFTDRGEALRWLLD